MQSASTRDRILDAAARVMREQGVVGATTKQIARAAGVAEGTLYIHFKDKSELFMAVLHERSPGFIQTVATLKDEAGSGTVEEKLTGVLRAALPFYRTTIPMSASYLYDPELLARHRVFLRERGGGPRRGNEMLARYLRAEQELGRVRPDADVDAIVDLLLGACLLHVLWELVSDDQPAPPDDDERYIARILATVMPLLQPDET
ncbi:MAG TPA: TetR/AcrR family transcriptional regulator [Thermomicrobiales bacterium]|nr:TetR/AcrR family transcriptional regulator [Thermomicrobiales bacterium]